MQRRQALMVLPVTGKLCLRSVWQRIGVHRTGGAGARLGPLTRGVHRVALRAPQLTDAAAWRFIRLRDRHLIEPFWGSSERSWAERHTEFAWVEEVLTARRNARMGRALSQVIEVDGRFAGQLNLERIDPWARSGEVSVWIDSTLTGREITLVAGHLFAEHVFGQMGLRRVTAPVCVDNAAAARQLQHFGMCREGTMASYLDVGGRRKDHDLWAITSEMWATVRTASPTPR